MADRIVKMSRKEVDRLAVIQQIQSKQISQITAAKQLWSYPDFVDTVTRPFYIDSQTPSVLLNQ